MTPSILVVEDEPEIRELLSFTLTRAGYEAHGAESAEQALQMLDDGIPQLMLVDWMLPGMSGVELARRLRQDELTADVPIIMLTARGEEADKLKSFASGIDDYITKPFSPRELLARIKALLRRSGSSTAELLEVGGVTLDLQGHRVIIGQQPVHIGPTEYRLLEFLMRHPERAFDRNQLLDRVWGRNVYVEDRTVDVHVLRLRKILQPHNLQHLIQTVRGVGYRFSTFSQTG
jgi:two-component system phosphate regulon response regulator PhoB